MRSKGLFSFFVCILLVNWVSATAGPSDVFNENDAAVVKNVLLSAQTKDGTFANIKTAHQAVWSLQQLNVEVPKKAEVCKQAQQALASAKDVRDLYHAVSTAETLNCGASTLDKVTAVVESSLASGKVEEIYYAALTTAALKSKLNIAKDKLIAAADAVKDLFEDDGTVKADASSSEGDVYNTGMTLQTLGVLHALVTLPEDTLEGLGDKVESLLNLAEDSKDTLSFAAGDRLELEVTATVLRGLFSIQSANVIELAEDQVVQFAEYFVSNKHVASVDAAYHLLQGLTLLSNNDLFVPLAVTLLTQSVPASGEVQVRVTNVLGQFATAAKVVLSKATAANDVKLSLFSNQELEAGAKNTDYHLNFLAAKPEAGFYHLEFKVTPVTADEKARTFVSVSGAVRLLKVTVSAVPHGLEIFVSDTKDEDEVHDADRQKLEHPSSLKQKLRATQSQHIHISFRVKNAATGRAFFPHQAFVRLFNQQNNAEAIFVPKQTIKKYKLDIEVGAVEDFNSMSGDYQIEVILGDAIITNPTVWQVGVVSLNFTRPPKTKQQFYGVLPEIEHVFRPPEKRPPQTVSTAFTGLVLAPVLVLLVLIGRVGINFRNFPFSGTQFLFSVGFVATLAAFTGVLGLFWLGVWNLVQTLLYSSALGVVAFFVGHHALGHLASLREKRQ